MKNITKIILIISFLLLTVNCLLFTANAAVPHLLNYQGRLTDSAGAPLNGSYNLTFRIYDAEAAGNLLWEETHTGAVIQKGIFSVLLGSITALNLPFDKPYFLEIKVGAEVMSPRQSITSAGYAIRAEETEKLGGKQPSDYALASDITSTPTANKVVRLDNNAKLPVSALKVYDSGWFAFSSDSRYYTKTHNLGTTKVLAMVQYAQNSDGSGWFGCGWLAPWYVGDYSYRTGIVTLTTTTIGFYVETNDRGFTTIDSSGNMTNRTSGYIRIIALALE